MTRAKVNQRCIYSIGGVNMGGMTRAKVNQRCIYSIGGVNMGGG